MGSAILHGTVLDDGGAPCEGRFNYGTTVALGTTTAWKNGLHTGDTFQAYVSGLLGRTRYYYRAELRNVIGVRVGAILWFMSISGWSGSLIPVVYTDQPTNIGPTGFTGHGILIDDVGEACLCCFEYGATADYGQSTTWVAGFVTNDLFSDYIVGLSPGSAFHYRAVARNRYGIGYGNDVSLTTLSNRGAMTGFPMTYRLLLREDK